MVRHWGFGSGGWLTLALLLAGASLPAAGQVRVVRGERIRASVGGSTVEGTVLALGDSSLVLRREHAGGLDTIPLSSIGWVEVSQGRHSNSWITIAGGVAGLMVGGLIDGSTTATSGDGPDESANSAGLPSLAGLVAGAYLGSRLRSDRWLHASLPTPGGAAAESRLPSGEELDARAAALGPFTPGSHIRFVLAGDERTRHMARVVRLSGDTLLVRPDGIGPTAVPLASLRAFELSDGWHRHTGVGALIGGLAGGVAGVAIGAATVRHGDNVEDAFANMFNGLAALWGGFLIGTGVGVSAGALIGHLDYHEHWRPERLPLTATVDARGRLVFAVRLGAAGAR